jgi:hypothetical protein
MKLNSGAGNKVELGGPVSVWLRSEPHMKPQVAVRGYDIVVNFQSLCWIAQGA